jgi:uncharacterized protein DUF6114
MESVPKSSSGNLAIPSSSILSIIAGSLIIIGGLLPLTMLGVSGHYGMMSRFGTSGMMGGSFGMMMTPFQSFTWTSMAAISAISIGIGAILIVGGYLIYRKPENAGIWGIAILVASIVSLFGMSSFLIGSILGIIGGILALTRR